jgi:hypothetical protein
MVLGVLTKKGEPLLPKIKNKINYNFMMKTSIPMLS